MKLVRFLCILAVAVPMCSAASKEIVELQRDVSNLSDQLRSLQQAVNQMQGTMQTQFQNMMDMFNRQNAQIAVLQNNTADALQKQQQTVSQPLIGVGQKVDQMSEDFRALRETVNDLTVRIGKLDQRVVDLQNAENAARNPPAPPPATGTTGGPSAANTAPGGPPAGMSAEQVYSNAYRDYTGGQYDLALSEFNDYVKYFKNTQFAPDAQYYVGDILLKQKNYDNALTAFDAVLEQYSDNRKTAAAHYMKGKTLLAMSKRDAAAKEFREVVSKFPDSDVAPNAKAELRSLGLSVSRPASRSRARHR